MEKELTFDGEYDEPQEKEGEGNKLKLVYSNYKNCTYSKISYTKDHRTIPRYVNEVLQS